MCSVWRTRGERLGVRRSITPQRFDRVDMGRAAGWHKGREYRRAKKKHDDGDERGDISGLDTVQEPSDSFGQQHRGDDADANA